MADSESGAFDPGKYLSKVGGADYLEVKWRLVWLRQRHPDAAIDTALVVHEPDEAVFKATVSVPGGGSATGWGSETAGDFRDYIEKAETKALGRALAALGFGTQFSPDHEFGANGGAVVDAPVEFASTRDRRLASTPANGGGDQPATLKQLKFIRSIAREAGMGEDQVESAAQSRYGRSVATLGRRDASAFIEWLQAERGGTAEPLPPIDGQPIAAPLIAVDPADLQRRIDAARTDKDLMGLHADLTAANAGRVLWDAYGRKAKAISSAG